MSLRDLLDLGVLQSGEKLEIYRRSAPALCATVSDDGQLVVKGTTAKTPSRAAQIALETGRPTDGWQRWRVPRLDGVSLAMIRDTCHQ